ncbi:MAG: dTMP kinase [Xanthobacteraceae bacterium]|nr:dTMP kinase [Xanthobacteraceae bacterium]
MRGRFISFEGGEGTGKSTHAKLLAERLRALAINVVATREPGGSVGAEIIRHVLLSGAAQPFGPDAEAILFAAARADHVDTTIRPALERGDWVLCDRFIDSTRVYQGVAGHADPRIIRALERISVGDTIPDLTLVLDVPPEIGLQRAAARRRGAGADRFEQEALDFHIKLRNAYRVAAEEAPERCVLIEAQRPKDRVAEEIWTIVQARLEPGRARQSLAQAAS